MQSLNRFNVISYLVIVLLAVAFLFVGNRMVGHSPAQDGGEATIYRARVTAIVSETEHVTDFETWHAIVFAAEITRGEMRGETAQFTQNVRGHFLERFPRAAREGDRIMLGRSAHGAWHFIDYVRIHQIIILGGVFMLMIIIFGRSKGFNALLALGLTAGAVFLVFIPSILAGRNIYFWSILVCMYTVLVTLFIINGISQKTAAAITGCIGGVVAAGVLTFVMNTTMMLTGITQTESVNLLYMTDVPINLNAIIFAGIIIGAVGAIMDMAVSVSSALWELKEKQPDLEFHEIFKSGIQIGKDILGSNINTLVLAYIGSSLTIILILLGWDVSLFRLMNRELIIVELLKAIVGSFGIFLTMPLTAFICGLLYTGGFQRRTPKIEEIPEEDFPFFMK
ncbi:MAG: YibE/F family protein [Defluviitaleaceae bacterium]|nr:YibE/F family protein [Defluviitaleaceae bacterium]MCL2239239.1 YibE/F family protein [Defluviitaleaceae bacterium]MCL2239807.1 YibE/F family protein [Defluviitaleaceae bacterium]